VATAALWVQMLHNVAQLSCSVENNDFLTIEAAKGGVSMRQWKRRKLESLIVLLEESVSSTVHVWSLHVQFSSVHFDLITQEMLHLQLIGGFHAGPGPH